MNDQSGGRLQCRQFLDAYTEYRDGLLDEPEKDKMAAHIAECASCGRYDRVLREGVSLLRSLEVEPAEPMPVGAVGRYALDLEQSEKPANGLAASGFMVVGAGLVAAVFAAVTWLPGLIDRGPPEFELSPVVAATPVIQPSGARRGYFPTPAALPFEAAPEGFQALSRSLLYQYGGPRPGRALAARAPRLD